MPTLEELKITLSRFFESKPIDKAWIFGSYARGEQTPLSDIDILVDFIEDNYPSLLSHAAMICDLEDIFNLKVDLVPRKNLYPCIKKEVEKDKILIYERS